jgi:hypothetical protein
MLGTSDRLWRLPGIDENDAKVFEVTDAGTRRDRYRVAVIRTRRFSENQPRGRFARQPRRRHQQPRQEPGSGRCREKLPAPQEKRDWLPGRRRPHRRLAGRRRGRLCAILRDGRYPPVLWSHDRRPRSSPPSRCGSLRSPHRIAMRFDRKVGRIAARNVTACQGAPAARQPGSSHTNCRRQITLGSCRARISAEICREEYRVCAISSSFPVAWPRRFCA